jgi:alkylation response protein AidB-like acyl-CoA dehydrogenase
MAHGSQDAKIVYDIAKAHGVLDDATARDNIGEARMLELVVNQLAERVGEGIRTERMSDQAAGLVRLFKGTSVSRIVTLAFDVAGPSGAAWTDDDPASMTAINFLMRQAGSIGGGTTEMARNVISERVLGMPRERRLDKDVPFRNVPRSRTTNT